MQFLLLLALGQAKLVSFVWELNIPGQKLWKLNDDPGGDGAVVDASAPPMKMGARKEVMRCVGYKVLLLCFYPANV